MNGVDARLARIRVGEAWPRRQQREEGDCETARAHDAGSISIPPAPQPLYNISPPKSVYIAG